MCHNNLIRFHFVLYLSEITTKLWVYVIYTCRIDDTSNSFIHISHWRSLKPRSFHTECLKRHIIFFLRKILLKIYFYKYEYYTHTLFFATFSILILLVDWDVIFKKKNNKLNKENWRTSTWCVVLFCCCCFLHRDRRTKMGFLKRCFNGISVTTQTCIILKSYICISEMIYVRKNQKIDTGKTNVR